MSVSPEELDWSKGLLPVIAQDHRSGEVRMVAFANEEALRATITTGYAHFHSRSRAALWKKGEQSGNTLRVLEVHTDCDRDTLLYLIEPAGPTCHTGADTCFFEALTKTAEGGARPSLAKLATVIHARRTESEGKSYTRKLLDGGPSKVAEKVREEGEELAQALESETDERVVSEAADVLYHVMVGLETRGLTLDDVAGELARRFGVSGLVEKAQRQT